MGNIYIHILKLVHNSCVRCSHGTYNLGFLLLENLARDGRKASLCLTWRLVQLLPKTYRTQRQCFFPSWFVSGTGFHFTIEFKEGH
jgi:hypothetical protein